MCSLATFLLGTALYASVHLIACVQTRADRSVGDHQSVDGSTRSSLITQGSSAPSVSVTRTICPVTAAGKTISVTPSAPSASDPVVTGVSALAPSLEKN